LRVVPGRMWRKNWEGRVKRNTEGENSLGANKNAEGKIETIGAFC